MDRTYATEKLGVFVVGVGIGAVAALFFAPKSGAKLRKDLAGAANEALDQLQVKSDQVKQRVQRVVAVGAEHVDRAIEAGQEAYNEASKV